MSESVAHHCPRVPNNQKNDPGGKQPAVGPIPTRESHSAESTEGIHGRLGPLFYWLHSRSLFSQLRHQDKFVDDTSEKDSMPPKFEVQDILRTLEQTRLENMLAVWDDGRMIVEEGHIALKDDMKFATRKYRAPYGLDQLEMMQEEKELNAACVLYVALMDHKKQDPAAPSPLSVQPSRQEKRSRGE